MCGLVDLISASVDWIFIIFLRSNDVIYRNLFQIFNHIISMEMNPENFGDICLRFFWSIFRMWIFYTQKFTIETVSVFTEGQ